MPRGSGSAPSSAAVLVEPHRFVEVETTSLPSVSDRPQVREPVFRAAPEHIDGHASAHAGRPFERPDADPSRPATAPDGPDEALSPAVVLPHLPAVEPPHTGMTATPSAPDPPPDAPAPSEPDGRRVPVAEEVRGSPGRAAPASPAPAARAGSADPPAAAAGPRVFVHISKRSTDEDRLAATAARFFRDRGHVVADVRRVGFAVGQPRVRFFFAADRPGAERVAAAFRAYLASRDGAVAAVRIEDFSHFRPLPARGNIEVWLASDERPISMR